MQMQLVRSSFWGLLHLRLHKQAHFSALQMKLPWQIVESPEQSHRQVVGFHTRLVGQVIAGGALGQTHYVPVESGRFGSEHWILHEQLSSLHLNPVSQVVFDAVQSHRQVVLLQVLPVGHPAAGGELAHTQIVPVESGTWRSGQRIVHPQAL